MIVLGLLLAFLIHLPLAQQDWVASVMEYGTNECAPGTAEISNEADCRVAQQQLGLDWNEVVNCDWCPGGCYTSSDWVNWNTHAGSARVRDAPICRRSTVTSEYQLVFRQTLPYLYAPNELRLNPENPSSDNYAILDDLERFRKTDGRFYFRMVWPGDNTVYEWSQTSNPVFERVEGYEAISVPFTGKFWGGLEVSNSALMDGSVSHSNWFYAVGSHSLWRGGIPSYAKSDMDLEYPQQSVELYVAATTSESTIVPTESILPTSSPTASTTMEDQRAAICEEEPTNGWIWDGVTQNIGSNCESLPSSTHGCGRPWTQANCAYTCGSCFGTDHDHDNAKCVKHAGREYEEMGSCCGLSGEITCQSGYELVAPIPDVCGGDCPENWCNHHNPNSPLRMARSYKCVPSQNVCADGYERVVGGDVPMFGEINGKGGRQVVSSCTTCANLCDDEPLCNSYECDTADEFGITCNLNQEAESTTTYCGPICQRQLFCVKQNPTEKSDSSEYEVVYEDDFITCSLDSVISQTDGHNFDITDADCQQRCSDNPECQYAFLNSYPSCFLYTECSQTRSPAYAGTTWRKVSDETTIWSNMHGFDSVCSKGEASIDIRVDQSLHDESQDCSTLCESVGSYCLDAWGVDENERCPVGNLNFIGCNRVHDTFVCSCAVIDQGPSRQESKVINYDDCISQVSSTGLPTNPDAPWPTECPANTAVVSVETKEVEIDDSSSPLKWTITSMQCCGLVDKLTDTSSSTRIPDHHLKPLPSGGPSSAEAQWEVQCGPNAIMTGLWDDDTKGAFTEPDAAKCYTLYTPFTSGEKIDSTDCAVVDLSPRSKSSCPIDYVMVGIYDDETTQWMRVRKIKCCRVLESILPTVAPTQMPTTDEPSNFPTVSPSTSNPSMSPSTEEPTLYPSQNPTTDQPTYSPSLSPSTGPTKSPSTSPTTEEPTLYPSQNPTTDQPTKDPSVSPSHGPTKSPSTSPTTEEPTIYPSQNPTTDQPTKNPSVSPSHGPTKSPSTSPSQNPTTDQPTNTPSVSPSTGPTKSPSVSPTTDEPTAFPSTSPTNAPTVCEPACRSHTDQMMSILGRVLVYLERTSDEPSKNELTEMLLDFHSLQAQLGKRDEQRSIFSPVY